MRVPHQTPHRRTFGNVYRAINFLPILHVEADSELVVTKFNPGDENINQRSAVINISRVAFNKPLKEKLIIIELKKSILECQTKGMSYDIKYRQRAMEYWQDGHSKKATMSAFKV
ncbi:MAG: hypothetical protein FWE32_04850, partial [Oscillospiraceae bacterium]|nr:hypothetical protein [Oscillospiraceae bacterium]